MPKLFPHHFGTIWGTFGQKVENRPDREISACQSGQKRPLQRGLHSIGNRRMAKTSAKTQKKHAQTVSTLLWNDLGRFWRKSQKSPQSRAIGLSKWPKKRVTKGFPQHWISKNRPKKRKNPEKHVQTVSTPFWNYLGQFWSKSRKSPLTPYLDPLRAAIFPMKPF